MILLLLRGIQPYLYFALLYNDIIILSLRHVRHAVDATITYSTWQKKTKKTTKAFLSRNTFDVIVVEGTKRNSSHLS